MTTDRPPPLTTAEIDLDGMPGFMLDTEQLRQSELWALSSGEEFKAAVGLWCRAWVQKPAGSLPNDDRLLAAWSGAGRRWGKVRDMALRGFLLCSDGRLYHPVLCQDAHRAWGRRASYRERASNAAAARWGGQKQSPSNASSMLKRAQGEGEGQLQGIKSAATPPPAQAAATTATAMDQALASSQPAPQAPHRLNFADWRIQVGHRIFIGQDERREWEALFAAEGWDSMCAGYTILDARHPKPAKLFLSMFQEIRK